MNRSIERRNLGDGPRSWTEEHPPLHEQLRPGLRTGSTSPGNRSSVGPTILVTDRIGITTETWFSPQRYRRHAATSTPRLLLEYVIRNVPRMAITELFDNPPPRPPGSAGFGLLCAVTAPSSGVRRWRTHLEHDRHPAVSPDRPSGRAVNLPVPGCHRGPAIVLVDRADGRVLPCFYGGRPRRPTIPDQAEAPLDPTAIDWGGSRSPRFVPSTSATALRSS